MLAARSFQLAFRNSSVVSYLIDSDWVIAHLRGRAEVSRRIYDLLPEGIGMSIISLAELYEGIAHSAAPVADRLKLHRFIETVEVVGLNEPICELFGRERARLRIAGELIGDFDLLIGCTAVHRGMTMLTNNRRHFERITNIKIDSI